MPKVSTYRHSATSLPGFLQQLSVAYLARGYWFYVTGVIPERKEPEKTDQRLLEKYGIGQSRWSRARRRRAGFANVHYLRFGRFFVLLASKGEHRFFADEAGIKDARRDSMRVFDYSVGVKPGQDGRLHPSVRIHPDRYRELKAYFLEIATHRRVEVLEGEFRGLPFERYAPVRRQLAALLRHMNRARAAAGLEPVPRSCLLGRRRVVRVFEVQEMVDEAA